MVLEKQYLNFNFIQLKNPADKVYMKSYQEEHVSEALYLGVLWKLYIEKSIKLDHFNQRILFKLSNLRNERNIFDFLSPIIKIKLMKLEAFQLLNFYIIWDG